MRGTPRQERSARTVETIPETTGRMIEGQKLEALTIARIAGRAGGRARRNSRDSLQARSRLRKANCGRSRSVLGARSAPGGEPRGRRWKSETSTECSCSIFFGNNAARPRQHVWSRCMRKSARGCWMDFQAICKIVRFSQNDSRNIVISQDVAANSPNPNPQICGAGLAMTPSPSGGGRQPTRHTQSTT
jgi:hypothetical protein